MESWNSVVISDSTKAYAWSGVMKAFKEDSSVPKYAKSLLELLIEERRELLDTQQKMVKIIDEMGRKVNDLSAAQFVSKSGPSSSNQTPANSDSSNEALLDSSLGSLNATAEIVTGEPLFYDAFPAASSSLRPKADVKEEDDEGEDSGKELEDYARIALQTLNEVTSARTSNARDSSSVAPSSSSKRKRPHSHGDASGHPPHSSALSALSTDHFCRFPDCDQSFECAADLEQHVRGHTYKQKHHCAVCGLGIRSETRLRDHMNQHTGERPYLCEYCGKGYTRVDAKNGHVKKCTENPAFSSSLASSSSTSTSTTTRPLLAEILSAFDRGSLASATAAASAASAAGSEHDGSES